MAGGWDGRARARSGGLTAGRGGRVVIALLDGRAVLDSYSTSTGRPASRTLRPSHFPITPYIDHNHVHRTAMRYDTRDARPVRFKEDKDANAPVGCSDLIGARRIARPEWPNRALIHAIYGLYERTAGTRL